MARQLNRTRQEVESELNEQLAALRASCVAYDAGVHWEAKRIATTLYLLLHDGHGKTKSLLTQLDGRDKLDYFSVLPEGSGQISGHAPLTMVRAGSWGALCVPIAEESLNMPWARFVPFQTWWNETVFLSSKGEKFTRKGLVIAIRNQDGGSHFDEALDNEAYAEFKQLNAMTTINDFNPTFIQDNLGKIIATAPNAYRATARQIAWELIYSFSRFAVI